LSSFFGRRNSRLTYFEFLTLVAFLYFAEQKVDMAVLEVGLGGRLDATNVATPLVSVITRIGMDHEGYLGRTLEDIAKEKAGIIKEGVPVVTVMQDDPAMNVIRNIAEEKKAMLHVVSPCEVRYKLGLLGRHQYENAALALRAAEIVTSGRWPVTGEQWPKAGNSAVHSLLETALAATSWPGRLEVISKKPIIIIDGAHNPNGAASLARFIKEELKPKKKRIVLLIGIMADKDVEGVVAPLAGVVDEIIATRPPMERAAMAEKIADVAERFGAARVACIEPLEKAIKEARSSLGEDDALVISGSLYMVGEIKKRPVEAMG
jgi:dihydrofolate synthase/folylpolyglutamate synthase